jgi:hypothetical protein
MVKKKLRKIYKFEQRFEKKIPHWAAVFFSITLLLGYASGFSQPDGDPEGYTAMLKQIQEENKKASMDELAYKIRHFADN